MELKHTIELIHIRAQHRSQEIRRKAMTDYLMCHPEIDREEAASMIKEDGIY
jgi:hypothetical protein